MRRKVGLVAALAGAVVALALFLILRGRGPTEPGYEAFPADVLKGYLPADTAAVVTLSPARLLDSPAVRGDLEASLRRLMRRATLTQLWLALAGIDPLTDLDQLQIVLGAKDLGRPLWLARGRIDRARFQVGPGKLRPRVEQGRRLYEYDDPDYGKVLLAPVGDTLVVSAAAEKLADALDCAAQPRPLTLRHQAFAGLLKQTDQGQAVWLAVSLEDLGRVGRLDSRVMDLVLRPVFEHARGIVGGLSAGADLRADFTFGTRDADAAARLDTAIKSAVELAQVAPLLGANDRDLLPLFQLLDTGKTAREATTISLRCRLPADPASP